ncbi:hypothetical protein G6O69_31735 [Pseudenhygromyxa sp. WMMC2535]|uniref:hypothetical protein n=1 Tax=Pseudenhygromyxa sp. WMMC2535 TaxID=2712867 RepID=UPI0015950456|nr:hypothetical protein [Pseudenhygromyxa sp. WMMC2535]NVB42438.1 hypothetical protein [Pseudenhygromyxa sp. WMMC2535]
MRQRSWLLFGLPLLGCQPVTEGVPIADDTGTSSEEVGCIEGQLDCACTPEGSCDAGLVCDGALCISEGEESSSSGEDTGTDTESDSEDTGSCSGEGCPCEAGASSCDPGLSCVNGECVDSCGNGALDNGEQCDDGNEAEGDGCDNDCSYTEVLAISLGYQSTCAVIEGGRLRCWGDNAYGQLGYGNTADIGDTETPASIDDVILPAPIEFVDLGSLHACGGFADGEVYCWGQNFHGQLGYGNAGLDTHIGDDELIGEPGPVSVGEDTLSMSLGEHFGCARLDNAKLRCWGQNLYGQLGQGNLLNIGDDELPSDSELPFIGADVSAVSAGRYHVCVITTDSQARCWGRGNSGQLGYGDNATIGDNEAPSSAGDVSLYPNGVEGVLAQLSLGEEFSCARFSSGEVLCWGKANEGQVGQGNKEDYGNQDGELPSALSPISLGGSATAIAAGGRHVCALLDSGLIRCWGANDYGQLGLGNDEDIGDDELPSEAPTVDVGGSAIMIAAGQDHTCAVLETFEVVCWGRNPDGRLGYGHTETIGDDESPVVAGTIDLL